MPVRSFVRNLAPHFVDGNEDRFSDLQLCMIRDHVDGMTRKQVFEKYKDKCENPERVFAQCEMMLHRLWQKDLRRRLREDRRKNG